MVQEARIGHSRGFGLCGCEAQKIADPFTARAMCAFFQHGRFLFGPELESARDHSDQNSVFDFAERVQKIRFVGGGHSRKVSRRPIPLTLLVADGKLGPVKNRKRGLDRAASRQLIARLNRDAQQIAWRFDLRYRAIEAERANVKSRYGICYDDGVIKIRLCHAVTGQPLLYSSLVSTLCHELAHLRYFNHGVRFRAFNLELLEFAREQGIYRPGRRPSRTAAAPRRELRPAETTRADRSGQNEHRPIQLSLF